MAFLATDQGSINERFIVKLEVQGSKVYVMYAIGEKRAAAYAELDDAKEFMDRVNKR